MLNFRKILFPIKKCLNLTKLNYIQFHSLINNHNLQDLNSDINIKNRKMNPIDYYKKEEQVDISSDDEQFS